MLRRLIFLIISIIWYTIFIASFFIIPITLVFSAILHLIKFVIQGDNSGDLALEMFEFAFFPLEFQMNMYNKIEDIFNT